MLTSSVDIGSNPIPVSKLNIMSRTKKQKNKAVSKSCMNNGGCPYCYNNRYHKHLVKIHYTNKELKDIKHGNKTETTDDPNH